MTQKTRPEPTDISTAESTNALASLLHKLAAGLVVSNDWPASSNVVEAFLHRIVQKMPQAMTSDELFGLERLSRKAAVNKELCLAYDNDWQKPVDKTPLPGVAWLTLSALLLHRSSDFDLKDPNAMGQSLNLINAAFYACDTGDGGSNEAGQLRKLLELQLQKSLVL